MMYYHSHYDDTTSMRLKDIPNHDDIAARNQLIRESGGKVTGEIWISGYGKSPVWSIPVKLDKDQQSLLCLKICEGWWSDGFQWFKQFTHYGSDYLWVISNNPEDGIFYVRNNRLPEAVYPFESLSSAKRFCDEYF